VSITERPAGRSGEADALALFAVLWALAAVWHLLGNPLGAPAWAQAVLALGVGLVLLDPGAPLPLAALSVGGLLVMWEEAPALGNHWLLTGFVDLAIVLAVVTGAARGRPHDRIGLAQRLFPSARLCLLGFYGFAAFAKLNSSFFDRSVSCAVLYLRESTASLGWHGLAGSNPVIEWAVIIGTVATELSIPILLVRRRTRAVGVLVGLVFHTVLALDHTHEFFDFSAVLFALFVLFLPASVGTWVAERVGSVRARLALRDERLPERVHLGLVAVPVVVALLVAVDVVTPKRGVDVGWWPWQLYALVVIVTTVVFLRQHRAPGERYLRPHHALFAVVPLLVVFNGLTPYLEVKTGYGWNMYANLRTVDGESNHLIVRRTLPLTHEQHEPVEILATSSTELRRYAAEQYGLTWRQLRTYLAKHPRVSITYRRGSETVSLHHASDRPELVEPLPGWREKVQLFRAIDLEEPTRCVPAFGPAR
jgi:hypothetical protein